VIPEHEPVGLGDGLVGVGLGLGLVVVGVGLGLVVVGVGLGDGAGPPKGSGVAVAPLLGAVPRPKNL
jgi:hypothetical protein